MDANPVNMTSTNVDTLLICPFVLHYKTMVLMYHPVFDLVLENGYINTIFMVVYYDLVGDLV